jgi:membrane-bound inhibitor of C-type lysozyme
MRVLPIAAAACLLAGAAPASTLTLALPEVPSIARDDARYQCDGDPAKLGLAQPFPVTYLNAGENHLAVMTIRGVSLVFVGVGAGSNARYVTGRYTWWDEPGQRTFLAINFPTDLGGLQSILCHRMGKS